MTQSLAKISFTLGEFLSEGLFFGKMSFVLRLGLVLSIYDIVKV